MARNRSRKGKRRPPPRVQRSVVTPTRTNEEQRHTVVGEMGPMPDPGAGYTLAPVTGLQQKAMWIPVPALARVARVAVEENLELEFPVPTVKWLMEGTAGVAMATRVTGEGVDFVRAFVKVPTTDMSGDMTVHRQHWMDLPTRYVAMMVEASSEGEPEDREPMTDVEAGWRFRAGLKPTWAGSHSFSKVWETAERRITSPEPARGEEDGSITTSPAKVGALHVKYLLSGCHVVRVEASQMEVLPDWDELEQAHDFAHDLNLPFEPLLLDFEGDGGLAPQMTVEIRPGAPCVVVLRGALVTRINVAGGLSISPYGDLYLPSMDEDDKITETARARAARGGESHVYPYAPMGTLVFDADTEGRPRFGPQEIAAEAGDVRWQAIATALNTELLGGPSTALVHLPHQYDGEKDPPRQDALEGWAVAVYASALRALAALSIMESDFVVVEDAAMERRDMKRAEKRGWKIASQVYIRPVRKGGHPHEPTGNERIYSHRFWVRGHMKHFPIGTRLATHRPDLVKPCTRTGVASCGLCRRVWTPPFIKGPEDKPLVLKSLVKKVE